MSVYLCVCWFVCVCVCVGVYVCVCVLVYDVWLSYCFVVVIFVYVVVVSVVVVVGLVLLLNIRCTKTAVVCFQTYRSFCFLVDNLKEFVQIGKISSLVYERSPKHGT